MKAMRAAALLLSLGMSKALQAKPDSENPIKKVVSLLNEMKAQVEKEGQQDKMTHDKYTCWCETNEKEKTHAIENAKKRVQEIETLLATSTAQLAQLKTESEGLMKEAAENKKALDTAAAVRAKEVEAYAKEEAETKKTRDTLTKAIKSLSKAGLLQKGEHEKVATMLMQVNSVVAKRGYSSLRSAQFKGLMEKDLYSLLGSMESKEDKDSILALAQASSVQLPGEPPKPVKVKSGPSKEVLGMISAMHDQFTRDLVQGQKRDFAAELAYQKVKAAKGAEIAAATELLQRKKAESASILEKRATADGEINALKFAINADTTFLQNMRKDCKGESKDFANRTQARNEEVVAIGEATQVLTEDSSRELFGKTVAFMQVGVKNAVSARETAYQRLAHVAQKHHNWALLSLSVTTRLDAMGKVKEVLNKALGDLKAQQKDEAARKEQCEKDLRQTSLNKDDSTKTGVKLAGKQEQVTFCMVQAKKELRQLHKDVEASELAITKATTERQEQNKIFTAAVQDAKATVKVLKAAAAKLKKFYAFVEIREHQQPEQKKAQEPAPPKGQAFQKQSSKAAGVLQLLQKIAQDAEKSELQLTHSEQAAEKRYAQLMQDAKKSIGATKQAIDDKKMEILKHQAKSIETKEDQTVNTKETKQITKLLDAHHQSCDFLLKFFEDRRQARHDEMDGITDAVAILSGAK